MDTMTADTTASSRQSILNPAQTATELHEHQFVFREHESNSFCLARRTIGICLLLVVVVLWTTSNFLTSTIFADSTYSKPFFVTYVNTSIFILPLLGIVLARAWKLWRWNKLSQVDSFTSFLRLMDSHDLDEIEDRDALRLRRDDVGSTDTLDAGFTAAEERESYVHGHEHEHKQQKQLGIRATARLSFQFCMLWFLANYFAMACLQFTTVGSTTILTSTSGVWTLIFGAIMRIEKFTIRKFLGVLASIIGIILISRVDMSSSTPSPSPDNGNDNNNNTPSFPHKSASEIALGDAMAAFSAMMYGIYTIVMKRQVGDESQVKMPLFFGLVGFFNLVLLWPGFVVLHLTGLEEFALPGSGEVWGIVLINAFTSLFSDICWAYAMLLTTPLVVTVGLSLTIPLSLIGQMFLQSYYASALYWVGAMIVVLSFVVVNHESGRDPSSVGDDDGKVTASASASSGGYEVVAGRDGDDGE